MTKEEIFAEATSVYDSYVEALETGTFEALQAYARNLSERIIPRGVETHAVVGIVLLLRDVLARSLFAKYQTDFKKLNRILDAYEPAAFKQFQSLPADFAPAMLKGPYDKLAPDPKQWPALVAKDAVQGKWEILE